MRRLARFAAPLGRAIAPVIRQADEVVSVGYSQFANAGNRRLQDILGRNTERNTERYATLAGRWRSNRRWVGHRNTLGRSHSTIKGNSSATIRDYRPNYVVARY